LTRLSRAEREREALRAALEREIEAARVKAKLLSTISHEIRTPLASVVGLAEILLVREYPKTERQQFLHLLIDESRRLTSLIDEHLDSRRNRSESPEIHGESPRSKIAAIDRHLSPSA
jgi:signal transduction histidine kinase